MSLRAVAREAGVSQAAPYAHFADKRRLMSAIAAAGFLQLHAQLEAANADGAGSLSELGMAYLAFARENPGLYNLMFGPADEIDPADEELVHAGRQAFDLLSKKCVPEGADARGDPRPIAAWSLVHGLAMLSINQKLSSQAAASPPSEILDLLQCGIGA